MATATRFISYLRVSTQKQGEFGLGVDAQRATVAQHVKQQGGELVLEFVEVESGTKRDRPQLKAAMAACRAHHATLIVAKLDRLARNVAFVSSLMESRLEFVAADMPYVNRLTIHVLAAVAEEEARMISVRTKAALAAAKARGKVLGNPNLRPGNADQAATACAANVEKARRRAADVLPFIQQARAAGATSLLSLAAALTARGIPTASGSGAWTATSVKRVLSYEEAA